MATVSAANSGRVALTLGALGGAGLTAVLLPALPDPAIWGAAARFILSAPTLSVLAAAIVGIAAASYSARNSSWFFRTFGPTIGPWIVFFAYTGAFGSFAGVQVGIRAYASIVRPDFLGREIEALGGAPAPRTLNPTSSESTATDPLRRGA